MASLGHIAVGMAAARIYGTRTPGRRAWVTAATLWSALSFFPDADVIGFGLGVRYEDEWGHRGATHSLAFSLALGTAIGAVAPLFTRPALRTGITAIVVLASHALLDTLTDGGLGIALFWPFDRTRFFAPWSPIPVSPIGLAFFSPYGLFVAATEAAIFAPVWWFALSRDRPARSRPRIATRAILVGVWVIALWLFMSTDPLRERVVAFVRQDDTEYATGFSEQRLGNVARGDTERQVRERLGPPFFEFLFYPGGADACLQIRIEGDTVTAAHPEAACTRRGVSSKVSREAVHEALGTPEGACWMYSRSPDAGFFRARAICFDGGRVDTIVRRWTRD